MPPSPPRAPTSPTFGRERRRQHRIRRVALPLLLGLVVVAELQQAVALVVGDIEQRRPGACDCRLLCSVLQFVLRLLVQCRLAELRDVLVDGRVPLPLPLVAPSKFLSLIWCGFPVRSS